MDFPLVILDPSKLETGPDLALMLLLLLFADMAPLLHSES